MQKNKCAVCGLIWGVAAGTPKKGYICPWCDMYIHLKGMSPEKAGEESRKREKRRAWSESKGTVEP